MTKRNKSSKRISLARDLDRPRWKVYFLGFLIITLFGMVSYKAFELQVLDRERAFKIAKRQHNGTTTLLPRRGSVLDRNMRELAVNVEVKSVYANPNGISDPGAVAKLLAKPLGMTEKELINKLVSKKSFVWIKRLIDPSVAQTVKELNLKGIGLVQEPKRVYPNGTLMGQVLGFTNIDSKGIEGLEFHLDSLLIGKPQSITLKRDARGRRIVHIPDQLNGDTSGHDVVLTIDSQIQHIVERELKDGIQKVSGEKGIAILTNPETGEILALASYPALDPNKYRKYPSANKRNLPIWYSYEPGSTMKMFLAASALEEKKANRNTTFDCEHGRRRIGSSVIKDVKPHGTLTLADVIKYSSNIGASKVGELLGKQTYHRYLTDFGFGEKMGIDLPGESSGKVLDPKKWGKVELATISFGQGVSVTALQLVTALSAIANGGYLMKPYVVKQIIGSNGGVIKENKPETIRRVISYDTAKEVTKMLESVVESGTGKKAQVAGYHVAGKTGTAQVPNPKTGKYYKDKYIASFAGFAPAEDPKVSLVVIVEAPKTLTHGGSVAGPIFKHIAEKVLFHMGVESNKEFVGVKVMPDLSGMSAREILIWSEKEGIKVKLKGSGFVKNQEPGPGELIQEGSTCSIELEQTI